MLNVADRNVINRDMLPYSTCQRNMSVLHNTVYLYLNGSQQCSTMLQSKAWTDKGPMWVQFPFRILSKTLVWVTEIAYAYAGGIVERSQRIDSFTDVTRLSGNGV